MTLKELSRYYNLQKQLERSRELLASLEASASPRAQALTGMPHSSGAGDKVGDLAAEIADTKAHIQRLERRAEQAAVRIRAYIDTIEDQHPRRRKNGLLPIYFRQQKVVTRCDAMLLDVPRLFVIC